MTLSQNYVDKDSQVEVPQAYIDRVVSLMNSPLMVASMLLMGISGLVFSVIMFSMYTNLLGDYEDAVNQRSIILVSPEGVYSKLSTVSETNSLPPSVLANRANSFAASWLNWDAESIDQSTEFASRIFDVELANRMDRALETKIRQVKAQQISSSFVARDYRMERNNEIDGVDVILTGRYRAWTGPNLYQDREESITISFARVVPSQKYPIGLKIVALDEPMFRSN